MEIIVDEEKCNKCGKCIDVCPKGPKVWIGQEIAIEYCINCGNCVAFCPNKAITINW
jgi:ferredoxin